MNFKPMHLNLLRYLGETKNREEWNNRVEVLMDYLLVLFVVAVMAVFIFSFLIL